MTNYRVCQRHNSEIFEYDPDKNDENKRKHGIDFVEAQALWDDLALVEIPALTEDEPRWVDFGKIGERHWSAGRKFAADFRESVAG